MKSTLSWVTAFLIFVCGLYYCVQTGRSHREAQRKFESRTKILKQIEASAGELRNRNQIFERWQKQGIGSASDLSQQLGEGFTLRKPVKHAHASGWTLRSQRAKFQSIDWQRLVKTVDALENQEPPWRVVGYQIDCETKAGQLSGYLEVQAFSRE